MTLLKGKSVVHSL